MIVQGDELSVQLEDSDPAESLRVQAETDQLKVVQCAVGSNVDVVVKSLSIFNWLLSKGTLLRTVNIKNADSFRPSIRSSVFGR